MKFRPCLDLHEGKVKQIVGDTLHRADNKAPVTNFVSEFSAAHFARMFREDRLTGGHVIMLGPGNEAALLDALTEYPGALHAGGGMNPNNAAHWLQKGAAKIIVSSYVFDKGRLAVDRLETLRREVGKDKLVLDLSCKFHNGSYRVMTDKWRQTTDLTVDTPTLSRLAAYASEFLIHAVSVEGTGQGIDAELVRILGNYRGIPLTYAGGIHSESDMAKLAELGQQRVDFTVGSSLDIYGGTGLRYRDVVNRFCRSHQTSNDHPTPNDH